MVHGKQQQQPTNFQEIQRGGGDPPSPYHPYGTEKSVVLRGRSYQDQ